LRLRLRLEEEDAEGGICAGGEGSVEREEDVVFGRSLRGVSIAAVKVNCSDGGGGGNDGNGRYISLSLQLCLLGRTAGS